MEYPYIKKHYSRKSADFYCRKLYFFRISLPIPVNFRIKHISYTKPLFIAKIIHFVA